MRVYVCECMSVCARWLGRVLTSAACCLAPVCSFSMTPSLSVARYHRTRTHTHTYTRMHARTHAHTPESLRMAAELIPDVLEVWELIAFFSPVMNLARVHCGKSFWTFCQLLEHPHATLFQRSVSLSLSRSARARALSLWCWRCRRMCR